MKLTEEQIVPLIKKLTNNMDVPKHNNTKFETIIGAINIFGDLFYRIYGVRVDESGNVYLSGRDSKILAKMKSLLIELLVRYKYSDDVKEIYLDFGINDYETDGEVEWKPKEGETFYFLDTLCKVSEGKYCKQFVPDLRVYEVGNCFQTREEAEQKLAKIKSVLRGEI